MFSTFTTAEKKNKINIEKSYRTKGEGRMEIDNGVKEYLRSLQASLQSQDATIEKYTFDTL